MKSAPLSSTARAMVRHVLGVVEACPDLGAERQVGASAHGREHPTEQHRILEHGRPDAFAHGAGRWTAEVDVDHVGPQIADHGGSVRHVRNVMIAHDLEHSRRPRGGRTMCLCRVRSEEGPSVTRTNSVQTKSMPPRSAMSWRRMGWVTPSMGAKNVAPSRKVPSLATLATGVSRRLAQPAGWRSPSPRSSLFGRRLIERVHHLALLSVQILGLSLRLVGDDRFALALCGATRSKNKTTNVESTFAMAGERSRTAKAPSQAEIR